MKHTTDVIPFMRSQTINLTRLIAFLKQLILGTVFTLRTNKRSLKCLVSTSLTSLIATSETTYRRDCFHLPERLSDPVNDLFLSRTILSFRTRLIAISETSYRRDCFSFSDHRYIPDIYILIPKHFIPLLPSLIAFLKQTILGTTFRFRIKQRTVSNLFRYSLTFNIAFLKQHRPRYVSNTRHMTKRTSPI